jgi:hypothetical protein
MREGKAPETIEEFVARTVLIPMLCEPATDQKDFRGTHRTLAYSMSELYKERLQSQWSVEQKKQLISNDYTSFIRSTGQKLAQRIAKNQFEGSAPSPDEITTQRLVRKARTDSVPPSREQVQWVLKPDRPDMPAKVKLVRDIFEVAGLDREEAAKIRQMISGSQTTVNLHAATARALEKLRGVCHAAAASKQLQMTPGEVKRIQAMLSINNPESLYDQIYESQRNGDLNARIIENELLSGLRKVVDAYTQSIKTNPAQDGLADKN